MAEILCRTTWIRNDTMVNWLRPQISMECFPHPLSGIHHHVVTTTLTTLYMSWVDVGSIPCCLGPQPAIHHGIISYPGMTRMLNDSWKSWPRNVVVITWWWILLPYHHVVTMTLTTLCMSWLDVGSIPCWSRATTNPPRYHFWSRLDSAKLWDFLWKSRPRNVEGQQL